MELDTVSPWNDGLTASLLGTVGASATEGFLAPAWGIHSDEETCIYLAGKLAFIKKAALLIMWTVAKL